MSQKAFNRRRGVENSLLRPFARLSEEDIRRHAMESERIIKMEESEI
jgi:hypothetical protein